MAAPTRAATFPATLVSAMLVNDDSAGSSCCLALRHDRPTSCTENRETLPIRPPEQQAIVDGNGGRHELHSARHRCRRERRVRPESGRRRVSGSAQNPS